jgi:tRNA pseudouridine55 synthase
VTPPRAGGRAPSGSRSLSGVQAPSGLHAPSGLVLLRKPEGITSFQALKPVKRALGTGKVGHAGTLDRFARGLLVVLAGSYSRLAPYIVSGEKLYRGAVRFGAETDTLDPEGTVVAEAPAPSLEELSAALGSFRGVIMQKPPAYSAVHVGGERAYAIALRGGEPELKERRVEIYSLELLSYEAGVAGIEVRCSSGTYIRSLARDIALACGSRAHLTALERLAIGPFRVEDATDPEAFDPGTDLRPFSPGAAARLGLRCLALPGAGSAARFANGGRIAPGDFETIGAEGPNPAAAAPDAAVFDSSGRLLGIIALGAEGPAYKVVMPAIGAEEA